MTTTYVTTNMPSGFSIAAQGDVLDVLSNGIISTTGTGVAVSSSYGCEIDVFGTIAGGDYGLYSGAAGQSSYIYVGATGNVLSAYYSSQFANVAIDLTGTAFVDNYGQVLASGSSGSAVGINGQTEIVNHGAMSGSSSGVTSYDSKATDVLTLDNYGTIDSAAYALQGRGEIDIVFNAGTMTGAVDFGSASGGSLDNTGTINGSVTAANGTTVTNSGVIMGSVNVSGSAVNLYGGSITVSGADDTVMIGGGTNNDLTIGGNGTSGTADVVNGSNAYVAVSAYSNVQVNGNADTVDIGASSTVGISGSNETIYFYGGSGSLATLYGIGGAADTVYGSGGSIALNNENVSVVGGTDTIYFYGGSGDVANLFNTTGNSDTVYGSNGSVTLTSAQVSEFGGSDTTYFSAGSGNVADLSSTGGVLDTVYGSGGSVALTSAQTSLYGGADTIYFSGGSGNTANLYGTNGNWDAVYGSNGTIALGSAQSNLTGNSNYIAFYGTSNYVTANGVSEAFVFQPAIGQDTINGFSSSDSIQFSASDFANFAALSPHISQSGSNALISLDANDTVTLTNTLATSLTSSQFHFV